MKTAVSIPDPVFDAAEELASRLGVSRSEVTERLDAVYGDEGPELDPALSRLQAASLDRGE